MLNALKFVQGAIAKKDFVPALTHFHIEDGYIKGYNGALALCCPIDLDIKASPKAVPFVKAINTCRDTVALTVQNNGKLLVKSGNFKAFIDCCEDEFPNIAPEGEFIELRHGIIEPLKKLRPFIAEDASRPWACGLAFRHQSAYATNNVCLVEHWLGYYFPIEINIPKEAIDELIRIKEEPVALSVTENNVTFHFKGNKWLRTQLQAEEWPWDTISRILDKSSNQRNIAKGFFEALEDLTPFVDEHQRIFFIPGKGLGTCKEQVNGAFVEIKGINDEACFCLKYLKPLNGIAETIDFESYPDPSVFFGKMIRGIIIGCRL